MTHFPQKNYSNDCTIVVCSCDKYADLLKPFATLWGKYWPDCPFPVVLVTETSPQEQLCFNKVFACGTDGNWCSRLVSALRQIKTPYVLMLCDDYYLSQQVNTKQICARLELAQMHKASNLRLIPNPTPKPANAVPFERGTDLWQYKPNTAYCIATQSGFWDRQFLMQLAEGKSSIWEFERYGSFDPLIGNRLLLVTPTKEFPFLDAVHKGYWEPWGLSVCRNNDIQIDQHARTAPPLKIRLIEGLKGLIFACIPNTWIVKIQNRFALGAKEKK